MYFRNYLSTGVFISAAAILGACSSPSNSEPLGQTCGQALSVEQGISFQGMSVQGISFQGLSLNGIQPQGLVMNGLSMNGLSMNGSWPNSLWANGLWLNGVTQTGELKGLALRGLTLEEAAEITSQGEFVIEPEHLLLLGLDDGILRGGTPDGTRLSGAELVGVLLPLVVAEGEIAWLRIGTAEPHPDTPGLTLYSLQMPDGENPCGEGVSGLFVPGVWDETGARRDSVTHEGVSFDASYSCTTGVIAKCVGWGYAPWSEGADIHQTCTRMARADYCGNGVPHTENGTTIDVFDTHGIQSPANAPDLSFEAGWSVNGAVCVSQPRYVDIDANGASQLPACWADKPTCDTWQQAQSLGAEVGNESAHTTRQALCAQ